MLTLSGPWIVFALLGSLQSSERPPLERLRPNVGETRSTRFHDRIPGERRGGALAGRSLELGAGVGCQPDWIPTFGAGEGVQGPGVAVQALTVHDDGSGLGPALYVGGDLRTAGNVAALFIARWDGASWSPVGGGMNNTVRALTVYDDGSGNGPELYAGGFFTTPANSIARWDGGSWTALGAGLGQAVSALAVHDDGTGNGPELYAGGSFGGGIRKWNGAAWSSVGGPMGGWVNALAVYDDGSGSGPALYAAGTFTAPAGVPAARIAKWDGTTWSALGSGLSGSGLALAVHDDGSGGGPALFVGGSFTFAGGVIANRVAKWNGTSWSALGAGVTGAVRSLMSHDDGSGGGPVLYAGGEFPSASGVPVSHVARWDGSTWSALLDGVDGDVRALHEFDDGSGAGPALYVGGDLTRASGVGAHGIARWSGGSWSALGAGLNDQIHDALVHDDGSGAGNALYVAGEFQGAGGLTLNHIGRWSGTSWSALGTGLSDDVFALAVHDDGSGDGPALYAGGRFRDAGGVTLNGVGKWDGTTWSALSTDKWGGTPWALVGVGTDGVVWALAVYDDGSVSGPALYAAGEFSLAGGVNATNIAKWDGESWSALGSGTDDEVLALAVYDDGSGGGPALYAAGRFDEAGGTITGDIAKWNGSAWSGVGGGGGGGASNPVLALAVHDDGLGGGPALYAGGTFSSIGGVIASKIAKWNGTTWSALGAGVNDTVVAIASYDDGAGGGSTLYVGGYFNFAGGVLTPRLAKWNGVAWSAVGSETLGAEGWSDSVRALTVYDSGAGTGPALVVGGDFTISPAGDSYVALWGGCASPGPGVTNTSYCFGDGTGAPCPCGNESGAGRGCANGTGFGALLGTGGTNAVAADDAVLFCAGLVPYQPGLYFQADNAIDGGLGIPFGDGLRCAGGAVERLEVVNADATGFSQTSVSLVTQGGVSAGETKRYQLWYRDPLTSPCGAGFNLSNGSSIAWQP